MISPGSSLHKFLFLIAGLIIPANCVSPLVNLLSTSDQSQQLAVQQKQLWQQRHPQSIANLSNA